MPLLTVTHTPPHHVPVKRPCGGQKTGPPGWATQPVINAADAELASPHPDSHHTPVPVTPAVCLTGAQANVWIAIFSYIGNYFWTHYFFTVLGAKYTFPSWTLNGVSAGQEPPEPPESPGETRLDTRQQASSRCRRQSRDVNWNTPAPTPPGGSSAEELSSLESDPPKPLMHREKSISL